MAETKNVTSVTAEKTAKWLSLSEEELHSLVLKDLRLYLFTSPFMVVLAGRNPWVIVRVYRVYKNLKKKSQQMSGAMLAAILGKIGGGRFCKNTEYCRKKKRFKELFDVVNDTPEVTAFLANHMETIELLTDVIKEVAEEIGDSAFPVSFIFISIKYGLDDLCNCCDVCDGSGYVNKKVCVECKGTGVKGHVS